MLGRTGFAIMLTGAVAAPYLLSSGTGGQSDASAPAAEQSTSDLGSPPSASANGYSAVAAGSAAVPGASSSVDDGSAPAIPLEEALRFDLTTAWVLGHWPRVSAGLADVDLQGYRVPLITGTQPDDLAGSLTYYFNKRQRLQRITFFGTTGDARRLVAMLALRHHFVRELGNDPSLFLYRVREDRKVVSELRIKPSSVVRAEAPRSRFEVALLIERPAALDDR